MHRIGILILAYYSLSSCNENREYCFCNKQKIQDSISTLQTNDLSVRIDSLKESKFYSLSKEESSVLWFNEIENPCKTEYTKLWESSYDIYDTSQKDFVDYFRNKPDIEIAFRFSWFGFRGRQQPYSHTYVVKKVSCCYLLVQTRTEYNRINDKQYALLNHQELEKLYSLVKNQQRTPFDTAFTSAYRGYLIDNKNKNVLFIGFEFAPKDPNILVSLYNDDKVERLLKFLQNGVSWLKTYSTTKDK